MVKGYGRVSMVKVPPSPNQLKLGSNDDPYKKRPGPKIQLPNSLSFHPRDKIDFNRIFHWNIDFSKTFRWIFMKLAEVVNLMVRSFLKVYLNFIMPCLLRYIELKIQPFSPQWRALSKMIYNALYTLKIVLSNFHEILSGAP